MIELQKVSKAYKNTVAIDNLSLKIEDNGIYCLLGRNGAGKTTLMKLVAGHLNATHGSIVVNGKPISTARQPDQVNFIESRAVQFNLKVKDMINTAAELQEGFDSDFAFEIADRFHLEHKKRYNQLSFGMQTMLTTLISLASTSNVVLLDEPVLGFDAIMRIQFYDMLLQSYINHPKIIIVSTHILDEISKSAQKLIIIDKGKLRFKSDIDIFDEKAYSITGASEDITPLIQNLNVINTVSSGGFITAYIFDNHIKVPANVKLSTTGLQDFFVQLVGGIDNE